jgi:hypothetical protein
MLPALHLGAVHLSFLSLALYLKVSGVMDKLGISQLAP